MTPHLMRAFPRVEDLEAVRGQCCHLYDAQWRKYLDFLAGVAVNALGHLHPGLVEAPARQAVPERRDRVQHVLPPRVALVASVFPAGAESGR